MSNTWVTCLIEGDSLSKGRLIPHNIALPHDSAIKGVICLCEGDNIWKRMLIPHNVFFPHERNTKDLSHKDELAAD